MLAKKKLGVLILSLAFSSAAWAGLGGITVRSHLGEPLRADIDFSGADSDLLRVGLAPSDTFRDLKVEFSPLLGNLRFTLAQRANGRSYIRVSSAVPVSEPYLRFVVEARMPSGRSIREYTVLLDPADYGTRTSPAVVTNKPVFEPLLPSSSKPGKTALPAVSAGKARAGTPDHVTVRSGQTLNQIAANLGVRDVSVRQVMAALVQANPSAFVQGDPARLRAGSRLAVPSVTKMRTMSAVRVNSLLAGAAAGAPAKVAATPAPAPDAVAPMPLAESAAPAAVQAETVVKLEPAVEASAAQDVAVQSEQALMLQQAQEKIVELEARLKAMQAAKPASAPVVLDSEPKSSMLDSMMVYLPFLIGGLVSILLGVAAIILLRRRRSRAKVAPAVAAAMPDMGGMTNMNDAAGNTFLSDFTRTGMSGNGAGEVDPIAEAEVYLAYGRDQQAEEILKDALEKDPTRHDVRMKLLEIYASRQDDTAFDQHARSLHSALDGKGALWDKVAKMGRALSPSNPLYAAAIGAAVVVDEPDVQAVGAIDIDLDSELMGDAFEAPAAPAPAMAPESAVDDDLLRNALLGEDEPAPKVLAPELDIEALLAEEMPEEAVAAAIPEPEADKHMLDFDFNLGADEEKPAVTTEGALSVDEPLDNENLIDFDFGLDAEPAAVLPGTEGLSVSDDPLATKLDLARVYLDMGDKDGAREVLEELAAEAEGSLKQEAEKLLSAL